MNQDIERQTAIDILNFIAHTTRLRSVFGDIPLVDDTKTAET